MTKSMSLPNTSELKFEQLPLKGFHIEVESPRTGWRKMIEGMGEGRFRVHMVKIAK